MESQVIATVALFAFLGFVFWIRNRARLVEADRRAQIASKLLDNLGSNQEAMAFLESESGRRLLDAVSSSRRNPYSRILGAATTGTILCVAGIGLLLLYAVFPDDDEALGFGIMALALGLGFLISAGVSHRLSKSWGLINGTEAAASDAPSRPMP